MKMKYLLAASVAGLSVGAAAPAAAQSAASVDFEEGETIVVSGARATDVGGVDVPESPKAKLVISEELIRAQRPGQTVNDIVNLVPGVNFQNNDPWGSGGGSFTIRGFSSDRISQTVDGVPLNDSGNYALYTNQQVDPEVLSSVNVNLGSTDVDSPTAAASGGTVNIRTRTPSDEMGVTMTMTAGDVFAKGNDASDRDRLYMRGFVMLDTGDMTGMGTKAFLAGSFTQYNNPFNNYGTNKKQQLNARIWQDIGADGDYVSVAGHYNQNRNNFFGSFTLPAFPLTKEARFYTVGVNTAVPNDAPCQTDTPEAGAPDGTNQCGTEFDRRYNPSNTGNIRGASRFTLTDGLTLSVEPSYQYVKANGGGTTTGYEYGKLVNGQTYFGYIGGKPYAGVDLNGDGDTLDAVTVLAPSQTRTKRYAVISNVAYEINPDHAVRFAYTWERANHRQTGQVGYLYQNGEPFDVFPVNDGITDANGNVLQKRDRQSYAILNQFSGQYIGHFGALTVDAGARLPFFKRELEQNCFTTSASGFVDCVYGNDIADYADHVPYVVTTDPVTGLTTVSGAARPQARTYKYDKVLPSLGLVYDFGTASVFGNFSTGIQVPSTDNLYNSLYYPATLDSVQPVPETTRNFDLGFRARRGDLMAQVTGWLTQYDNRLASAYDPVTERSVFRNLGRVDKYGLDGSISWQPTQSLMVYVFGSVMKSKIKDDILGGICGTPSSSSISNYIYGCDATTAGDPFYLPTAGKRESGAAGNSFGGRVQWEPGAFRFGLQAKHTGKRYINDENRPLFSSANASIVSGSVVAPTELYAAAVDGYTLVDFDARYKMGETPWGGEAAIQLNVTNLLDELYVGGFGGSLNATNSPFVQIGAPRAASLSLVIGY